MVTPNQWIIPFNIVNGLTRMTMQPCTNEELDQLPHAIITSNDIWEPTVLDHYIDVDNDICFITQWILQLMQKNLSLLMNAQM